MKRVGLVFIAILIIGLGLTGCALPAETPTPTPSPEEPSPLPVSGKVQASVVRVIDGDTIEVDIAGTLYKVRYIGIDTPELGQLGGEEARLVNMELVGDRVVELEKDVSETDKYGRLLRYVWVEDYMVNAMLVAMGYAQVSTYPPDVKYQDDFLELQGEAREKGSGLWGLAEETETTPPEPTGKYVGSINSDVYHYPTCTYAQRIYPENLIWFSSPADAKAQGYRPCKVCHPP